MLSIFFDLETSDSHYSGQILNYSFIVVDQGWNQVGELTASVKLSPLQLPTAGAILTNRVNLDVLANEATESERQAAQRIFEFLNSYVSQSQTNINLIGYNSSGFDVQYIRTVLIRNGLNPFFGGKISYRDLLHVVRRLACTEQDFPRVIKTQANGHQHYSYSLQNMTQAFDLLQAEQTHYSRDDVLLTIELARYIQKKYGLDVRNFNSNDGVDIHEPGKIVFQMLPEHDPEKGVFCNTMPMALLKNTPSGAFWINLNSFLNGSQDRSSIHYVSKIKSFFVVDESVTAEIRAAAQRAMEKFKGFDADSFYPESTNYIEEDIYRLFKGRRMDRLFEILRRQVCDIGENEDVRILFERYRLENYDWQKDTNLSGVMWSKLKSFALERYSGNVQASRSAPTVEIPDDQRSKYWLPGFMESYEEIQNRLVASDTLPKDRELLEVLEAVYRRSEINRVVGFIPA
jgi:hypothetical protein